MTDIEVELGGHRMAWMAVSDRGRAWADAHSDLTEGAPEGVECLAYFADPLIARAVADGLTVAAGDVEVHAW